MRSMGKRKAGKERKLHPKDGLRHPAVGMEAEFNVEVDGEEINPEKYWRSPTEFIDRPLVPRLRSSYQLPSGGAVYFDRGVIEVVTPVIEIAPRCSARVVRSLWEQIGFVRSSLTDWEARTGHVVRLRGYSTHYNVSYEIPAEAQTRNRNVRKLAHLLAFILPPPLMLIATNRLSTGVGARPRGDRVEITLDFTPDPSLMIATATAIIGIVREVMSWDSYRLEQLEKLPFPRLLRVIPGKHTTRKGWLTKDVHYPQNPFAANPDEPIWECTDGKLRSMREIGLSTAEFFSESIRRTADPFSVRLLFGVLRGRDASLLDLAERPVAYDHVGVLCRWGRVLTDLILRPGEAEAAARGERPFEKAVALRRRFARPAVESPKVPSKVVADERAPLAEPEMVKWTERREANRRVYARAPRRTKRRSPRLYPDRNLSRSLYERVFLALTSGQKLLLGNEKWAPVGMEGWYRARFRCESDGRETTLTIDELTEHLRDWQ